MVHLFFTFYPTLTLSRHDVNITQTKIFAEQRVLKSPHYLGHYTQRAKNCGPFSGYWDPKSSRYWEKCIQRANKDLLFPEQKVPKSPHCLGLEYQNGAHKIEAQSLNSTTNHHKVVRLTIISFTIFGSVCLFFGHFNLKTLLKWMSFYKWPLFDLFWPLFHRMCVYLSQNLGSDGHFEVLNGSKSWLGKTLWPQM